jgi:hypothetical protein
MRSSRGIEEMMRAISAILLVVIICEIVYFFWDYFEGIDRWGWLERKRRRRQ